MPSIHVALSEANSSLQHVIEEFESVNDTLTALRPQDFPGQGYTTCKAQLRDAWRAIRLIRRSIERAATHNGIAAEDVSTSHSGE